MSAPTYSSYAERYDDPSQDPFRGAYRGVLETFAARTMRESNTVLGKLFARVVSTTEVQPHAYLMLHHLEPDEPYVTLLHRPFNITPLLGQNQPEQTYCFLGDVSDMIPPQVAYFPADAFEACGNVRVPTEDILDGANTDANPICGPYAEGEVGTEVVQVRRLMYLPSCFVPLALEHPRLTTYDAWNLIGGAVRNKAEDTETSTTIEDYRPLLNWLRVACTYTVKDGATTLANAIKDPLSFPIHLDNTLRLKIKTVLQGDLPGYGAPLPTSEMATVTAINALTSRITEANDAADVREQCAKEKTPNDYFGEDLVVLLQICHVATAAELPRLWHALASSTKCNERIVIEEHFRATADDLCLLPFVPHISPAFVKKMVTLSFAHHDIDDLEEGIHPFLATFKDQRARADANRVSSLYDDVMLGAGAPLADLAALRAAEKVGVPLDLISVGYTYQGFRIVLHALLGSSHLLTQAYDGFVTAFMRKQHYIATVLPAIATPGQLVRHTQIRVSNWFSKQVLLPERVPPPDFQDMLTKIRYQESWAPRMPNAYHYQSPSSDHAAVPTGALPPTTTTPPARMPASALPPASAQVAPTAGRGTRISNPSYHTDFTEFKALSLPLKSVRDKASAANKPVPKNNSGTEYCLSFHVNGFCWDNCSCKEDHHTHKVPEHKALVEWCKTCYRADGPA
jgi:hypothetical protein